MNENDFGRGLHALVRAVCTHVYRAYLQDQARATLLDSLYRRGGSCISRRPNGRGEGGPCSHGLCSDHAVSVQKSVSLTLFSFV